MLTATMMCSPASRMDVLSEGEIQELLQQSQLVRIYNQEMDRESAFELLNKRMQEQSKDDNTDERNTGKKTKEEAGTFEKLLKSPVVRSMGVAVAGMVTRSLLGSLGLKTRSHTARRK